MNNYKTHISTTLTKIAKNIFLYIAALSFGILMGNFTITIITSLIEVEFMIKTIMLFLIIIIMFITFYYAFK